MPNIVNRMLLKQIDQEFDNMGSCIVVSFDKLTVEQDENLRNKIREAGHRYSVVKNRLAIKALRERNIEMADAFKGKCGVIFADEDRAISAAKLVREEMKKIKPKPPLVVTGGVIEGEAITGDAADRIADMPDRETMRAMLAQLILAPANKLARAMNGVSGGLARCIQAKIDKGEG